MSKVPDPVFLLPAAAPCPPSADPACRQEGRGNGGPRGALDPSLGERLPVRRVLSLGLVLTCLLAPLLAPRPVEAQSPQRGPALPRLEGKRLASDDAVSTDLLRRRNGVVFYFSPKAPFVDDMAKLVAGLARDAAERNVGFLGIAAGTNPAGSQGVVARAGLDFPVIHDEGSKLAQTMGIQPDSTWLLAIDSEGYVVSSISTNSSGFETALIDRVVREALHLPLPDGGGAPVLGVRPPAPGFDVVSLDQEKLSLASLENDVVLVVFFLHTCPHCHEVLKFVKQVRDQLGRDDFKVVPISIQEKPAAVADMVKKLDLDYPVYLDPGRTALDAYPPALGVPHTFLLDREHRIVASYEGSEPRIQALLLMGIHKELGARAPILLAREAYSGEEACRVCHPSEHETWSLTNHAYAFETLVEHGQDHNEECLRCHTVGFGEPGGYDPKQRQAFLEGVQCENCHGRGGPHQSPDFAKDGLESACKTCHTTEHSLRFDFAERLPLVSHAANTQFASLSVEERRELLAKRDKRERTLFDDAAFVGSAKCGECHTQEFERWKAGPHAGAFATLETSKASDNADCQKCHTTGFDQKGGFPEGGEGFHGVGCESCHGPGGNHLAQAKPTGSTILGLTDKCDSCVILQICGTCHDDANDPRFEYEVEEKIDLIRHGFRDRKPPKQSEGAE